MTTGGIETAHAVDAVFKASINYTLEIYLKHELSLIYTTAFEICVCLLSFVY